MATAQRREICILSSAHPADDIRIFQKQAKCFADAGYNVTFIVPHDRDEIKHGVRIVPLAIPRSRFERMIMTVWRVWRKALAERADVYHFHDPELMTVGLLLKLAGKRVVYDVHEDVPRQILSKHWIPSLLRKVVSIGVERLECFAAKRFDAVVAATPFIADRFRSIARTSVVCNYPMLREFEMTQTGETLRERAVCYVGGISEVRGLLEMVKAMGETDVKLLLAGTFSIPEQREKAASMRGWTMVEELGYMDREGIRHTMARSVAGLVMLHPLVNYRDALPIKMFEYMAAGIPVIASDFPVWHHIVHSNDCGICVDPLDPSAIATAVRRLADHPEEAARMGANGRYAVIRFYNWEEQAKELLRLYDVLLPSSDKEIKSRGHGGTENGDEGHEYEMEVVSSASAQHIGSRAPYG